MNLGVCYYPEHWPQERWATDARLMVEAGISLVRIAEFAWAKMEPREGDWDWDWLDEAIQTLASAGLKVVLGTPTAAPPAWLCRSHPDILPMSANGEVRGFGSRRHYCPTSPTYRSFTAKIVTQMAKRYGEHPAVVAWQIDNELGDHDTARCYCPRCAQAFQGYLREKYKNLEALNAAWGTIFWSQTYTDWEEIGLPAGTVTTPNPSQVLDYYRFASNQFESFTVLQADILRSYSPGRPLTTNFMGTFSDLNAPELARHLDFASWDSYPTGNHEVMAKRLYSPEESRPSFAYDVGDPYVTGFGHALTRGLKNQQSFWVMEQQAGNINWSIHNTGIRQGTVRLWTWHAAASSAEAVVYFRWRAALYAQEQYHSGLLRHDASPALGIQEVHHLQGEHDQLEHILAVPNSSEVAILIDYEDLWSFDLQPHRNELTYLRLAFVYYRALMRLGIPASIVYPGMSLESYRLVIVPSAHIVSPERVRSFQEYVQNGGALLFGIRSGFKTSDNQVTSQPLPGDLRPLVGTGVSDWQALPPGVKYDLKSAIPGFDHSAGVWMEALQADETTQTLATYQAGPFSGEAALTRHSVGQGQVFYLGVYPQLAAVQALLEQQAQQLGIRYFSNLPKGLVIIPRQSQLLLLNFTDDTLPFILKGTSWMVPGRDVRVVEYQE